MRPTYAERPVPARLGTALALWGAASSLLLFAFSLPEPWLQMTWITGQPLAEIVADPSLVARLIGDTRFGRLWLAHQLMALAFTSVGALLALRGGRSPRLWAFAAAIGLLLPGLAALAGHVATRGALPLVNHLLHWGAATVWLGGLFHLLWISRAVGRSSPSRASEGLAALTRSFSPVALTALILVVLTGAVNAWLYVPDVSYLTRSSYGGWLLIKMALVAGLLVLAAYNGIVAAPALQKDPARLAPFRFGLTLEGFIGAGVLAASYRLASQPPVYGGTSLHLGRTGRIALEMTSLTTVLGLACLTAGLILTARAWGRGRTEATPSPRPRRGRAKRSPSTSRRTGARWLVPIGLGVVLTSVGTGMTLYSLLVPKSPWFDHPTPLPASAEVIEMGRAAYASHCTLCHGPTGRGDGPLAPSLSRPPGDLTGSRIGARSDGDLMWTITHGVDGTDMPSFAFLSEEERWALVHHIRSLREPSAAAP